MNSFSEIFKCVLDVFAAMVEEKEMTPTAFDLWLKTMSPVSFDGAKVVLSAETEMTADIVRKNYLPRIESAFETVLGFPVEVLITHRDDIPPEEEEDPRIKKAELESTYKKAEYEYTFDTFIVGSSNKFAYAAAVAVANDPGDVYNPLFIHGPSGLGKTHLLTAIHNHLQINDPGRNIIYVTGEAFANELITAIQQKRNTSFFHEKYRNADVLLVDDVQFIAGKESTQEEFFHTFNELHKDGKQIVLTSDRPPKDIKTLEDRIKTRFEWGLIADISIPDYETRFAIIKRKAELLDLRLDDSIAEVIAVSLNANIRQLEGCVKKLKAIEHLVGTPPILSQAQAAIREVLTDDSEAPITVKKIMKEVSAVYGVNEDDIISDKRSQSVSNARKVCCYIIKEMTPLSFKNIGLEIGQRDHSTIIYYVDNVKQKMAEDRVTRETINDIIRNIESTV
jgi:chromosomal replication initiator protein